MWCQVYWGRIFFKSEIALWKESEYLIPNKRSINTSYPMFKKPICCDIPIPLLSNYPLNSPSLVYKVPCEQYEMLYLKNCKSLEIVQIFSSMRLVRFGIPTCWNIIELVKWEQSFYMQKYCFEEELKCQSAGILSLSFILILLFRETKKTQETSNSVCRRGKKDLHFMLRIWFILNTQYSMLCITYSKIQ